MQPMKIIAGIVKTILSTLKQVFCLYTFDAHPTTVVWQASCALAV